MNPRSDLQAQVKRLVRALGAAGIPDTGYVIDLNPGRVGRGSGGVSEFRLDRTDSGWRLSFIDATERFELGMYPEFADASARLVSEVAVSPSDMAPRFTRKQEALAQKLAAEGRAEYQRILNERGFDIDLG